MSRGRMNVLFIAHRTPYPPNKGDKLRSLWELKELSKCSDVDLLAFYDDPGDGDYVDELKKFCRHVYLEKLPFVRSRVNALRFLLRGRSVTTGFFYSAQMAAKVDALLKTGVHDRVVVFSSSMAQYVEKTEIFKVLDLVDVDSDKWQQYAQRQSGPSKWLWRREGRLLGEYEARMAKEFSCTLVCTEGEAALLRSKATEGSIEVLQNFLDVNRYDPTDVTLPEEVRRWQPYLVFSGSMDYFPNVDAVTYFCREIFPLIHKQLPSVRLVIAGRNPIRAVRKLVSSGQVELTGSKPDLRPYLAGAAAAVVPMRIARGVQNKILEALATGIPVISTSAAANALPESLRSLLSVADTPDGFSTAVIRSLRDGGPIPPVCLRSTLKDYMERLDLPRQLEMLVRGQGVANCSEEHLAVG